MLRNEMVYTVDLRHMLNPEELTKLVYQWAIEHPDSPTQIMIRHANDMDHSQIALIVRIQLMRHGSAPISRFDNTHSEHIDDTLLTWVRNALAQAIPEWTEEIEKVTA